MSSVQSLLCRVSLVSLAFLFSTLAVPAQFSGVDPTFNPVPSGPLTSATGIQQVVQPDGKIIVFGFKGVINGVAKGDLFRLNPDGSLDNTFSYCGCGVTYVTSLKLMADGRMVVSGTTVGFGKIIRLNPDGSIDPTFLVSTAATPFGGTSYTVDAVQPDGKVIATRRQSFTGFTDFGLFRYNTDGSQDATFTPISLASGSPMAAFVRVELLADGRFYLAVTSGVLGSGGTLSRRNPNGTVDPTWETPSFTTGGFPPQTAINDIAVDTDGSVVVVGRFESVNGTQKQNLVRLQSAGNVDLTFAGPTVFSGHRVRILADRKILFSGNVDISGLNRLMRLSTTGTVDNTYTMDAAVTSVLNGFELDPQERTVFMGQTAEGPKLIRLLATGSSDESFSPRLAVYGRIFSSVSQPDGRVLLAGVYNEMNGVVRNAFARVNSDGSLDATFDPGTGFDQPPDTLLVQADGKILAVGPFTSYNGTTVPGLVRINANGSIDGGFVVSVSSNPLGIALEPDGQVLICGSFTTVNGVSRTGVARLNDNGSLDNGFNPVIGTPTIRSVVAHSDGRVVIGGSFSGVNGFNRSNLARLTSDGSLDQTFTATGVGSVGVVAPQSDGKYVLTIGFPFGLVDRRNIDGSDDSSFNPPAFSAGSSSDTNIHSILVMPDNSILVGGRFDTVGAYARRNLARLGPNGAFDVLFMLDGADARVRTLADYSSGKVIAGGDFTTIGNVTKAGVARLDVVAFRGKTPYDFNGDGRADYTVYRPSSGVWYELSSASNQYEAPTFGLTGDIPVPADFDGDGKTDEAIWRPSNGDWWYLSSINNGQGTRHYGMAGDLPRPGDFDGDGKADFIVFRPSNNTWYRSGSSVGEITPMVFGLAGDQPLIGDFDGDGKVDPAIFRPSSGDWWYAASSAGNQHRYLHWGATGDIPVPADYDGDGKTDYAVFRPSNGGWYVYKSSDNSYFILGFGLNGDRPVPADYDGDGRADIAVFRPSNGVWYLMQSTAGSGGVQWGLSTDVAAPNAYMP